MSYANQLQRNLRTIFKGVGFVATCCVGYSGYLWYFKTLPSQATLGHRSYLNHDLKALRVVGTTNCIPNHRLNPGVRVEPEFLHHHQAPDLIEELEKILELKSADPMTPEQKSFYTTCLEKLFRGNLPGDVKPNMKRVTINARGKTKYSHLPTNLWAIIRSIERSHGYDTGEFKSLTIDYRENGFLWTPPRREPLKNGENVFYFTTGQFPVVYTLSPTKRPPRKSPVEIAHKSFSDMDLDICVEPNDLLHLSGPARFNRRLGIRMGLPDENGTRLRSFFGRPDKDVDRSDYQYLITIFFDKGKLSWKDVDFDGQDTS